jgi:FkbM family methyltransferase
LKSQIARVQSLLDQPNPNPSKALMLLTPLLKRDNAAWPVLHYIGIAYLHKRKYGTALEWLEKSKAAGASEPETYYAISLCHFNLGAFQKAARSARIALEKRDNYFKAWEHLGTVYRAQAKLKDALRCFQKANQIDPDNAGIAFKIAKIYSDQGRLDKALELFEFSINADKKNYAAYAAMAEVLITQNRLEKAEEYLNVILEARPNNVLAGIMLSYLYRQRGNYQESIELCDELLKQHPKNGRIRLNYAISFQELGRFGEAEKHYLKALKDQPEVYQSLSNYLMCIHYNPQRSKKEIFEAHKLWDQHFAPKERPRRPVPSKRGEYKKLRIGLLSGGFQRHPVGWMITQGLENLPDEEFEVYCYSTHNKYDYITKRINNVADKWQSVIGYNDDIIAGMIREDEIDILIELSGHAADNRLRTVALEPAPIIVKWVGGLFNTTGLRSVDYLITDWYETPKGEEQYYTEKLVRMPDDYVCYLPPDYAPEVGPLPKERNGHITLGCFNNPSKVNSEILRHWARIMNRLPDSCLMLKSRQYDTEVFRKQIIAEMAEAGISEERIIFKGHSNHKAHMSCYNQVDIALDPWPYSGGVTTCESLWMGVPVISKPGPTFAGRHSATHLNNAGFPEWVVDTWDEYVETTVALANQDDRLAELRSGLRKKMEESPLCDGRRFGAHLSIALREIWKQRAEGYETGAGEWKDHIEVDGLSEKEIEDRLKVIPNKEEEPVPENSEGRPVKEVSASEEVISENDIIQSHTSGTKKKNKQKADFLRIEVKDGNTICYPNNLNWLTPYVLQEQQGWFETESLFVDEYLEPGMKVIDVGAGFGVYSLPMANTVGSEGMVFAFEPGFIARQYLKESIRENDFPQLKIIDRALADSEGRAKFFEAYTPELNKLDKTGTKEVQVTTLDTWWASEGRPKIDFIKVDVNGSEAKVIDAADSLLSQNSPVVMFAIGEVTQKAMEGLGKILRDKGYRLYEYVAGIRQLTRFDPEEEIDPYLMNLIAVEEERVKEFEKAGWIYNEKVSLPEPEHGLWKKVLGGFSWTEPFWSKWEKQVSGQQQGAYLSALNDISAAVRIDPCRSPGRRSERGALVVRAVKTLIRLYNDGNAQLPISMTLARGLNLLGKRGQATEVIKSVMEAPEVQEGNINTDIPFFLPLSWQDCSQVKTTLSQWLTVRLVEAWIMLMNVTTYLAGNYEIRLLGMLEGNPENSEEIKRRIQLLKRRVATSEVSVQLGTEKTGSINPSSNHSGPLFIHLCFNNMHTQSFVELLEAINRFGRQKHVTFVEKRRSVPHFTVDLTGQKDAHFFTCQKTENLVKVVESARPSAIIVHGLFYPWQKKFINQVKTKAPVYWSVWGGDLYNPIKNGAPLYDVVKNIDGVISKVDGDYELLEKTYGKKHRVSSFSYGVRKGLEDIADEVPKIKPRRIVVGNSGDVSNHHLEVIEALSLKKDIRDYQIYIPFAYNGSPDYLEKVKRCVRQYGLDDITTFQTEFLPPKEYDKILMESSYLICAHDRQQALGTIKTSLYFGNIVFARNKIKNQDGEIVTNPTWQFLSKEGLAVQSWEEFLKTEKISVYDFPEIEELSCIREKLKSKYDVVAAADKVEKAFNEILKEDADDLFGWNKERGGL